MIITSYKQVYEQLGEMQALVKQGSGGRLRRQALIRGENTDTSPPQSLYTAWHVIAVILTSTSKMPNGGPTGYGPRLLYRLND